MLIGMTNPNPVAEAICRRGFDRAHLPSRAGPGPFSRNARRWLGVLADCLRDVAEAVTFQQRCQFTLDAGDQPRTLDRPAPCRAAPAWRRRESWHKRQPLRQCRPRPPARWNCPAVDASGAGFRWKAANSGTPERPPLSPAWADLRAGRAMVVLETIRPSIPLSRTTIGDHRQSDWVFQDRARFSASSGTAIFARPSTPPASRKAHPCLCRPRQTNRRVWARKHSL